MASEVYYGRCKCCLKETYLKNMWFTGQMNEDEIFGQMLVDCFSIDWMIHGDLEEDKICEDCITKLKIAVEFKRQVLRSQTESLNLDKDNNTQTWEVGIAPTPLSSEGRVTEANSNEEEEEVEQEEVEEEESSENDEKDDDFEYIEEEALVEKDPNDDNGDCDSQGIDDDSQDYEPVEKQPKLNKKQKHKRTRIQLKYTEEALQKAVEAFKSKEMTRAKAAETFKVPLKAISRRAYGLDTVKETDGANGKDQRKTEVDMDTLLSKHRDNIQSILIASNATIIKGHWGVGYACYSCPQQFTDPAQLKKHTFTHKNMLKNIKIKSLAEYVVKLDVTNLKCNICVTDMESLEDLMLHLKGNHGMSIHMDIPNHIMPFSFDADVLKCVQCPETFENFKVLSEHMNDAHYRNFECAFCKRGFVNVRSLKTHSISHGVNIYACTLCQEILMSKNEMTEHEKTHAIKKPDEGSVKKVAKKIVRVIDTKDTVHGTNILNKDNVAPDPKTGIEIVKDDSVKSQGGYKCKSCPSVFEGRSELLYHVVSTHKPHKCAKCNCSFDFQFKLKKHMGKEHPTPSNKCSKCNKRVEDKSSIVAVNNIYTCEVCCSGFNVEAIYLAHMKNNHGLEK